MTTVFLVDDHEVVRRGISELIDAEPDLTVVGEAANAKQAVGRILATRPDVAVIDVKLPDRSGIDVCRELRTARPPVRCLMLTAFDDDSVRYAAVMAGASGFVVKDIRGAQLIESIRSTASGQLLIDLPRTRIPAEPGDLSVTGCATLTRRERQVLELIAAGLTNRQIGDRLELAEKTVKNYVSALLMKLGMQRRTQAAVYGAKLLDE